MPVREIRIPATPKDLGDLDFERFVKSLLNSRVFARDPEALEAIKAIEAELGGDVMVLAEGDFSLLLEAVNAPEYPVQGVKGVDYVKGFVFMPQAARLMLPYIEAIRDGQPRKANGKTVEPAPVEVSPSNPAA